MNPEKYTFEWFKKQFPSDLFKDWQQRKDKKDVLPVWVMQHGFLSHTSLEPKSASVRIVRVKDYDHGNHPRWGFACRVGEIYWEEEWNDNTKAPYPHYWLEQWAPHPCVALVFSRPSNPISLIKPGSGESIDPNDVQQNFYVAYIDARVGVWWGMVTKSRGREMYEGFRKLSTDSPPRKPADFDPQFWRNDILHNKEELTALFARAVILRPA